ncbi:hypothetical protein SAMN02746009_03638 [Hymenobacter psychrotolerans DSM 18569]|uniref:Uncharacterized protein n=1 Tax=Hymenobacter psychrotolerans DSM 18569 TaxID=1121959 RepID=A0A1M7EKU2_9BACT|nr:hypothetical protein SAMN02746009_03638 [Hymenobacter psychrotolerans DSM 18569]
MSTAYYPLLHLLHEHVPVTFTLNMFGNHCHVFRGQTELGHVGLSDEDVCRIKAHAWGNTHPFTPRIPIERLIRILAPATS